MCYPRRQFSLARKEIGGLIINERKRSKSEWVLTALRASVLDSQSKFIQHDRIISNIENWLHSSMFDHLCYSIDSDNFVERIAR